MDTSALKRYAPQARKDFIAAITDRAGYYGITKSKIQPVEISGDVAIIAGKPFPKDVSIKRQRLVSRITDVGFDAVMESIAYTWFNRFMAIRYMELHGYLEHGYRVLSHPDGNNIPEIIEHAEHVSLPDIHPAEIIDLKLAGNQEDKLYRKLLIAQCNALHRAMPFLFEQIDDETELLLPENLLHSNSIIRKLIEGVPEDHWQHIEVIGWIYQFYISERKDQVIGKVVKSEDIPAATQLFTPNWIVRYLVQNSLGRKWLATYPDSTLKSQMEYYIEDGEQSPEVQEALKKITPTSLNPESLTVLDPACGSGHILVETYDLFKAIYLERGYRLKDIPRLILCNNLFGLEIDERAAQLAAFALIMKAREDDHELLKTREDDLDLLKRGIPMNIRYIVSSENVKAEEVYDALTGVDLIDRSGLPPAEEFEFSEEETAPLFAHMRKQTTTSSSGVDHNEGYTPGFSISDIRTLLGLFKHEDAKTFGSLIRIPQSLVPKLQEMVERTDLVRHGDDLSRKNVAERFTPIVEQAWILSKKYDAVVANPPYMGGKGMNGTLKTFLNKNYADGKSDLFAAFIIRNIDLAQENAFVGMITMQSWMFLSSYEKLRSNMLSQTTLINMAHLGARAFDSIGGEVVSTTAFVLKDINVRELNSTYLRLISGTSESEKVMMFQDAISNPNCDKKYIASATKIMKIPGSPIAYWAPNSVIRAFENGKSLDDLVYARIALATGDNCRFIRSWQEVSIQSVGFDIQSNEDSIISGRKWFTCNKGGDYRKWYGNNENLLNWLNDGEEVKSLTDTDTGRIRSHNYNGDFGFKESVTWSALSSSKLGVRYSKPGYMFVTPSSSTFKKNRDVNLFFIQSLLSSNVADYFIRLISMTMNIEVGNILRIPVLQCDSGTVRLAKNAIGLGKSDWDSFETSWDFTSLPLLHPDYRQSTLMETYQKLRAHWREMTLEMQRLEEENNRIFIEAYGLQDELTPEVPLKEITLTCNPQYRYGGNRSQDELEELLREDTIKELISYAVGCMVGRYSLDEPGLIYAHSGNMDFDATHYTTYPADDDGIIPITEYPWFDDDATHCFESFLETTFSKEQLETNLNFIADVLGRRSNESSRDTLRRYLATGFFKEHLQTYKKRPIYWLFNSGRLRTFQCLVYLHRYNEGTLARMRTEYIIPLLGKMHARQERLKLDVVQTGSTTEKRRLENEQNSLDGQLEELRLYDEKVRHYADEKISLDLDDGVKVNYGKFGDLLAEVKAVTGSSPQ